MRAGFVVLGLTGAVITLLATGPAGAAGDAAAPPPPAGPAAGAKADASLDSGFGAGASADAPSPPSAPPAAGDKKDADERNLEVRRQSLDVHPSLRGSSGLLRTYEAGSGASGTFRFGLFSGWFTGSGFLCTRATGYCGTDSATNTQDDASRTLADVALSVTPLPFLEVFGSLHSQAASNNRSTPKLLQVLGDAGLGVKGFLPQQENRIWNAGLQLDLTLLNGSGSVGFLPEATGFAVRGLGSLDFTNRVQKKDRLPIKVHLNLGYESNSSGALVAPVERARNRRITRIERFGLSISRTDFFEAAIGAEFPRVIPWTTPFLEWSIDAPVNRQGYTCNVSRLFPGDQCLGNNSEISTMPSRLTLGARVNPVLPGLSLLGAIDIGTGATGSFIEEVVPEAPWTLRLGISYAVDAFPPQSIVKREVVERVVADETARSRYVVGTVVETGTSTPVASAAVRYKDKPFNGMLTNVDGSFRTIDLEPGTYNFVVTADGYRDGDCQAVIPKDGVAPPAKAPPPPVPPSNTDPAKPPPPPGPPPAPAPAAGEPVPPPPALGVALQLAAGTVAAKEDPFAERTPEARQGNKAPVVVKIKCEVKALPKVGNVVGSVTNSASGKAVVGAKLKIEDKLGRSLTLDEIGEDGSFRFENVVPGTVTITVEAKGFMRTVQQYEVLARKDVRAEVKLNPVPKKAKVVVERNEVKLLENVLFKHGSAEIQQVSLGIVEEIGEVVRSHPELELVEVQGHTDDTGDADYNRTLSQQRADAVMQALVRLGIDAGRLTAKGYGQDKPLVKNTSEANRAKNRRVQLVIQKRGKGK